MAHLPDITPDRPRKAERPGGLRSYSDDERARMRGLLRDMGTNTARPAEPTAAGRKKRGPLLIGGIAALIAGIVWWAPPPDTLVEAAQTRLSSVMPQEDVQTAAPAASAPAPATTPVPPAALAPAPALEASGKVIARREATLSSDLTGRVAELLVAEGDRVERGQPIARLDAESAQAQFAIAKANVAAAEEDRAVVAAQLDAMESDLARTRTLAERGVASQEALSTLEGQHAVLEARMAARDQQITVQRRQLDAMRNDLERTMIHAYFGGIVTEITANVGEIVSPVASGSYTRTGIATIVDPNSIVGEVNVNEQFLSRIEDGQRVEMSVPAWPDRTFPGHVALVTPVVDDSTAAVRVIVAFDPVPDGVYPGMRLDVAFLPPGSGKAADGPAAPRSGEDTL